MAFTQLDFMGGNSNQLPAGTPLVYASDILDAVKSTSAGNNSGMPPVFNFISNPATTTTAAAQPKRSVNLLHVLLIIALIAAAVWAYKKFK